jgi:NAD(P)H-dependent flavin oxidoreductase YrpB (nitropropane dioxygenase family)
MFGIDVPIFAFSHCRDVVVAVSRSGGLGVLGAALHSSAQLDLDLRWIEDHLNGRPYGVDIAVPASAASNEKVGTTSNDLLPLIPDEHRRFVEELLTRYEVPALVDPPGVPTSGGAAIATSAKAEENLDLALRYQPVLVVNALGPPPASMIDKVRSAGLRVGALAGKPQHAREHLDAGVELIIAQGSEAGGHTGDIGSMVLIPEIVDAAGPVPVLGAGGIGRGRQMAAAMALGALGVWCGSVWLTTDEAETHPVVKRKMLNASSGDTIRSRSRTGKPARQLRSAWTDEWAGSSAPSPLPMPLQPLLVDEALARIDRAAHHPGSGAEELVNYYVGQVVGSMNRPMTAAQVVYEMIDEFVEAVQGLSSYLREG